MEKRKITGGFTLIELLVVIAIIAVLAAILFPAFLNAKDQARKTACLANMKQVGLAYMMYAGDWGALVPVWVPGRTPGEPPPSSDAVGNGVRIKWYVPNAYTWVETLHRYTHNASVFICPSAVYKYEVQDGHIRTSFKTVLWSANPNSKGIPPMSTLDRSNATIPEGWVARPKESIVLCDTKYLASNMQWDSGDYANMYYFILYAWRLDTNPIYEAYRPHFNRPNFLFCDGHVDNGPYSKYARNRHWYIDKGLAVRDW